MRRYTIEDVADIQSDALAQPSKLDAVSHLAEHFEHLSPHWIARHLRMLTTLDPIQLVEALHPDPTGEQAVRSVMKEKVS